MIHDIPRLTIIAHSFPPVIGGGETLVYLLAKYLSRLGWDISIVTGETSQRINQCEDLYKGFKVLRVPLFEEFSKGEVGIKFFLENVYKAIKDTSPQIMHTINFYPGFLGSIYTNYENIPMIFTYHNTPEKDGRIIKMFRNIDVERAFVRSQILSMNFNCLITQSRYFADNAISLGIPKKVIKWCYPGPDPEVFFPQSKDFNLRRSLGVRDEEILIVVPARIVPRKRVEIIIKAAILLKKLPIKIIISSGGIVQPGFKDYYDMILKLIDEYSLPKMILLPKHEFRFDELGHLYAAADIGLLASSIEGLGLGILEMMRCGVPVVATNTEGINEIIVNKINGLLFPVDDYKKLAKHIRFLINHPLVRLEMGRKAIESVNDKFSLSKYVQLHDMTYRKLLMKGK